MKRRQTIIWTSMLVMLLSLGIVWVTGATPSDEAPAYAVKVDLPENVTAGQTVTASVTVTNSNTVAATDVTMGGLIPNKTTHVSGGTPDSTIASGYTYATFSFQNIPPGESVSFEHSFKIPADAKEGNVFQYDDVYIKSTVGNNIWTQYVPVNKRMSIPVPAVPVSFDYKKLQFIVEAPSPISSGGNYTIKIEVRNNQTSATPELSFYLPVPDGTTYASGGTAVTYNNKPFTKFEAGVMMGNTSKVLEYTVTIPDNPTIGTAYPIQGIAATYPSGQFIETITSGASGTMLVEAAGTTVAQYNRNGTPFSTPIDGYQFQNYGNENHVATNDLTPADVFLIFGPSVCKTGNTVDTCKLTAAAETWRTKQINGANGGHCEGMAVTSLSLFEGGFPLNGKSTPSDFGAQHTSGLAFTPDIQNYIMYYFVLQGTDEVYQATAESRKKPSEIVQALITEFNKPNPPGYTLGIYQPGYKKGHAITATAIEKVDDDNYRIIVYDNNFPKQRKYIEVDMQAETWRYSTSATPGHDPDAYEGNATTKTLEFVPLTARKPPVGNDYFTCDFCQQNGRSLAETPLTISYSGEGDILIIDPEGRKSGYDFFGSETVVDEIPNTNTTHLKHGLGKELPPKYQVPYIAAPNLYEVYVGAHSILSPTNGSLTIEGKGFIMGFDHIELPADGSTYRFQISPDGQTLSIDVDTDVLLPSMYVAFDPVDANTPSVIFELDGLELSADEIAIIELNQEEEWVYFETSDPLPNFFDLYVTEIDADGNVFEGFTTVQTPENLDFAYVDFGVWDGTGKIPIVIQQKFQYWLPFIAR